MYNWWIEALIGWVFLTLWGKIDPLGLPIFWILMRIGGAEVSVPIITWVVLLGNTQTVFISIGISQFAYFQFTTGRSLKTCAALGIVLVTISSKWTVCNTCKSPPLVETSSPVAWWTGGMISWTIAGISLFTNNLCWEFPLVVSVVEFLLLVWVAINGSLFGLLMASTSSLE